MGCSTSVPNGEDLEELVDKPKKPKKHISVIPTKHRLAARRQNCTHSREPSPGAASREASPAARGAPPATGTLLGAPEAAAEPTKEREAGAPRDDAGRQAAEEEDEASQCSQVGELQSQPLDALGVVQDLVGPDGSGPGPRRDSTAEGAIATAVGSPGTCVDGDVEPAKQAPDKKEYPGTQLATLMSHVPSHEDEWVAHQWALEASVAAPAAVAAATSRAHEPQPAAGAGAGVEGPLFPAAASLARVDVQGSAPAPARMPMGKVLHHCCPANRAPSIDEVCFCSQKIPDDHEEESSLKPRVMPTQREEEETLVMLGSL